MPTALGSSNYYYIIFSYLANIGRENSIQARKRPHHILARHLLAVDICLLAMDYVLLLGFVYALECQGGTFGCV